MEEAIEQRADASGPPDLLLFFFRAPRALAAVYPALVRPGSRHFHRPRRPSGSSAARAGFAGEFTASLKRRVEGVRVQHGSPGNSRSSCTTKAGSVLRLEPTIANTANCQVFRPGGPARAASRSRGAHCARASPTSTAARRSPTSTDPPPGPRRHGRPHPAPSPARTGLPTSRITVVVAVRFASATPLTWPPSPRSAAGSLRRPAFAIATSAASSIPASLTMREPPPPRQSPPAPVPRARRHQGYPKTHRYRVTNHGHLLTAAVFAVREATLETLVGTAAA